MLRRTWAAMMATLLLAGCASQPSGGPDYEDVERDAEEAQRELERETAD